MIIRDFRKEDIQDVIECAKESFVEEFERMGFDPDHWRRLYRRRFSILGRMLFCFFGLLGKEPVKFFVADVDGKVVGTTMVTKRRKIGYVETVMVHPNFRRKGIATGLMKTAINYVRKRKFAKAILHVLSVNDAAKSLYQQLGFKKFDESVFLTLDLDSLPNFEKVEGIQVRGFKKSDTDAVYEMIKNSRDPNWLKVYDFKKNDLKPSLWNRIARMSRVKKIVAVKDGKIVGYTSLSYTTLKEAARIETIEVCPELVSIGVEEELIRVGIEFLKSSGTKTVLVIVSITKEGLIRSLEALGFKKRYVMEGMLLV